MNTFSSVKKMKSAANLENFFRSSLRAVQFASVSYDARRLLKHLSCRSFSIMRTTDDLGMHVFRDISRTVLWVRGWSSWLRTVIPYRMFSSVRARTSQSVAAMTSAHCAMSLNFLNNLLMILVLSSILCLEILSTVSHNIASTGVFFIRILSSSLKTMLQTMQ